MGRVNRFNAKTTRKNKLVHPTAVRSRPPQNTFFYSFRAQIDYIIKIKEGCTISHHPVDPNTSWNQLRGVAHLQTSRGHSHPVIRAIGVSYTACKKTSFDENLDLTAVRT